jgi:hypothetical protein
VAKDTTKKHGTMKIHSQGMATHGIINGTIFRLTTEEEPSGDGTLV